MTPVFIGKLSKMDFYYSRGDWDMCDVRLFKSGYLDFQLAKNIWIMPYNDEMFLNNAAYHIQQCVEKITKGALECIGVMVPNTHRLSKLFSMVHNNGANLIITDWIDDHAEMLSEWEAESRYNMDFLVVKRKLEKALIYVEEFLQINGIQESIRKELESEEMREKLLQCLPKNKRNCSVFELNCYYIMFAKKINKNVNS